MHFKPLAALFATLGIAAFYFSSPALADCGEWGGEFRQYSDLQMRIRGVEERRSETMAAAASGGSGSARKGLVRDLNLLKNSFLNSRPTDEMNWVEEARLTYYMDLLTEVVVKGEKLYGLDVDLRKANEDGLAVRNQIIEVLGSPLFEAMLRFGKSEKVRAATFRAFTALYQKKGLLDSGAAGYERTWGSYFAFRLHRLFENGVIFSLASSSRVGPELQVEVLYLLNKAIGFTGEPKNNSYAAQVILNLFKGRHVERALAAEPALAAAGWRVVMTAEKHLRQQQSLFRLGAAEKADLKNQIEELYTSGIVAEIYDLFPDVQFRTAALSGVMDMWGLKLREEKKIDRDDLGARVRGRVHIENVQDRLAAMVVSMLKSSFVEFGVEPNEKSDIGLLKVRLKAAMHLERFRPERWEEPGMDEARSFLNDYRSSNIGSEKEQIYRHAEQAFREAVLGF